MTINNMPAAEAEVSESMVRRLLEEQHPDLARLDIRLIANGWDNAVGLVSLLRQEPARTSALAWPPNVVG